MNNGKIKCIICGNIKTGSDEHIIPKSLGNEILRTNLVCKECNEGLGKYVDEHLVNNFLSQMIRQQLKLKGQSKKIPNPFAKGKDSDGIDVYVDNNFKPSSPLRLKQEENKITTTGGTQQEAVNAIKSKLKRMGKTDLEIQKLLGTMKTKEEIYQPKIQYESEIYIDKLFLGALKIAYEYMYITFKEEFTKDEVCEEIREILYDATIGKFDKKYNQISLMTNEIKDKLTAVKNSYPNAHALSLNKDAENQLILNISLFLNDFLSFSVCVSKDASKYNLSNNTALVIVDIDNQKKISI